MHRRSVFARLATSLLPLGLLVLAACPSEGGDGRPTLLVTVSPGSVLADGVQQAQVTVNGTDAAGEPLAGTVLLTTTAGAFDTGTKSLSTQLAGGTVQATLTTCNSGLEAGCAGTTRITAAFGASTASASIVFEQFRVEELCEDGTDDDGDGALDCADPDCEGVSLANGASCEGGTRQCPGGQPEGELNCLDGVDNDCDGLIDCLDAACAGLDCGNGGTCDNAGACVCSRAGVEGATLEDCRDNIDNDCDGLVDGEDPDCLGRPCPDAGSRWADDDNNGATPAVCGCFKEAETETACNDGFDNDCANGADCDDPACAGAACEGTPGQVGLTCSAVGACLCAADLNGDGLEANCGDGVDDDCDGLTDCADLANCAAQPCGTRGEVCSAGACVCPFGEATETSCGNGRDDDCDGLIDCADPDCNNRLCDVNGQQCSNRACVCLGGTRETSCGDLQDNDCDGNTDCADLDCHGLACGSDLICEASDQTCVTDPGTDRVILQADQQRVLADGVTRVVLSAEALNRLGSIAGTDVTFSVPAGQLVEAFGGRSYTATTDLFGRAQATWIPGELPAKDLTATATLASNGATALAKIQVIGLASMKVRSIQYTTMGVRESGYQESNQLEFQVLGTDGVTSTLTIPDGLTVTFDTGGNTNGGLYLTKTSDVTSGNTGIVITTAKSGTVATTFAVRATASMAGNIVSVTTPSIAIIGAKATQRGFTFQCAKWNVGALLNADQTNSNTQIDVACTVSLKDRFTNPIALPTAVSFASEAGTIDTPRATKSADPVGTAVTNFHTFGILPEDVPPIPSEPYWVLTEPVSGLHYIKNPRDGLVTVMAFTNGEEEFVDGNGDGTYNDGDFLFIDRNGNGLWDAPEVYTDQNGNGQYDPGETFVDSNGNGVWDSGEDLGDADGDCRFDPAPEPYTDTNGNGIYDAGEYYWDRNRNCRWDDGEPFTDLNGDGIWNAGEQFRDTNGNGVFDRPERYVDSNSNCRWDNAEPLVDTNGNGVWDPAEPFTDANNNKTYDVGEAFTDTNGNGVWDDAEVFTDTNGNGKWDPMELFTDTNGNGIYDAGEKFVDRNGNGVYDAGEPFTDLNGNRTYDMPEVFNDYGLDRMPNTGDFGEGDGIFQPGEPFTDLDGDCVRDVGDTFVDVNGNGLYERGEFFVDLAEPFLDANDNSTWDPGEFFKDVNQNGKWNGPNCRWDRNTQIWTQTRVLETGASSLLGGRDPGPTPSGYWNSGFHYFGDGTSPEVCVANGGSTAVDFVLTDENINLPRGGTVASLKVDSGPVKVRFDTGASSYTIIDHLGMDWGLATDCRGSVCSCTSGFCTVRSYLRALSGGAYLSVILEDSTTTDTDPPKPFGITATYNGCPSPCVFSLSGMVD